MSDVRACPGNHTDAHPAPQLRPGEHLCRGCITHAERLLSDLVALTRDVEVTVTRQARTAGSSGARAVGHEPPLPVDVGASDRARRSLELLFEWADFVAERTGQRGIPVFARHVPLQTLVPRAVAIILRHSQWMRLDEQGPDLANAIRHVRRDLRRLVDTHLERLYAGPCDADLGYDPKLGYECRGQLFRQWGAEEIVCDGYRPDTLPGEWRHGCGTAHTTAERREWLLGAIGEHLLPLRVVWEDLYDLVPGFDVDWETARKWPRERRNRLPRVDAKGRPRLGKDGQPLMRVIVTPPRLTAEGWDGDTPLFKGSDILRVARDSAVRPGRRRRTRRTVA